MSRDSLIGFGIAVVGLGVTTVTGYHSYGLGWRGFALGVAVVFLLTFVRDRRQRR